MDRMLAGVSTRRFADVGEPVGAGVEQSSSSTGKTAVSDMFIERTRTALGELMSRRLADVRLAVMMLDGLEIAERTHVVALGSRPRASRSRSGCGRARRRTPRSRGRCWPISSTAAWIPSRRFCS